MGTDELARLLLALHLQREGELRDRFDRSLPFADGLFDRWERAKRLGFAEGASIYNSALVFGEVHVGRESWVGPYTLLDGSGGRLEIGGWCSISAGVQIYTHDTVEWALSGGKATRRTGPVSIGDCTYIGSQSIVALDTKVGHHSVIAANSFVNADVPPYSIVGGSPARRLGRVQIAGESIQLIYDQK